MKLVGVGSLGPTDTKVCQLRKRRMVGWLVGVGVGWGCGVWGVGRWVGVVVVVVGGGVGDGDGVYSLCLGTLKKGV